MYYHLRTVNDNYAFIHKLLKKLEKNDKYICNKNK